MMEAQQRIGAIRVAQWATPRPGLSLAELVAKLAEQGVTVLGVDEAHNRVLLSQETTEVG